MDDDFFNMSNISENMLEKEDGQLLDNNDSFDILDNGEADANHDIDIINQDILLEENKNTTARTKITKKDLEYTPVPIFDCIYCVSKCDPVFEQESVKVIAKINRKMIEKQNKEKK